MERPKNPTKTKEITGINDFVASYIFATYTAIEDDFKNPIPYVKELLEKQIGKKLETAYYFKITKIEDNKICVESKGESYSFEIDSIVKCLSGRPVDVEKTKEIIGENGPESSCSYAIYKAIEVDFDNHPYVFIIDEINRGELSKIFGELFFSIDPGYRGIKGRIATQYQNLVDVDVDVDKPNVFKGGFYVPENVYIIGTMNDIDRGVESMDFAVRRRFAWYEVKAKDREDILDSLEEELAKKAKARMENLNEAISNKGNDGVGLTEAYHIGPAYFLKLKEHIKLKEHSKAFEALWDYHIKGVLSEYLRGDNRKDEKLKILKTAYDKETTKENGENQS